MPSSLPPALRASECARQAAARLALPRVRPARPALEGPYVVLVTPSTEPAKTPRPGRQSPNPMRRPPRPAVQRAFHQLLVGRPPTTGVALRPGPQGACRSPRPAPCASVSTTSSAPRRTARRRSGTETRSIISPSRTKLAGAGLALAVEKTVPASPRQAAPSHAKAPPRHATPRLQPAAALRVRPMWQSGPCQAAPRRHALPRFPAEAERRLRRGAPPPPRRRPA